MLRFLYKNIVYKLTFLFLRYWGGEKFANQDFSPFILLKHLFIQKILRINSHVPWPVHPTSNISCIEKIDPGSRCPGLSPGCYIQAINGIILGKNVWIGANVGIISGNHSLNNYFQHLHDKPIKIGDNCWIGMNSVILPGVEIGNHVIIGAGSIVTHSFESNCVIAGNPARIIKRIKEYRGQMTKNQLSE